MEILIREAVEKDIDPIADLLGTLFEQEAEFRPSIEVQKEGIRQIIESPGVGKFLVAEESGKVVGTVNLLFTVSTALGGKVALLEDLVIDLGHRKQGIGKKLLEKAISYAQENGCLRLTLLTDPDNDGAQSLYLKHGFKISKMVPLRLLF